MMMFRAAAVAAVACCTACGSYKAVRPGEPAPVVAETENYQIGYESADGQRISAVYLNSHSPMTVVLRQGHTEETLKQIHSLTKAVEYANATTRWTVQDGFAALTRRGKTVVFREMPQP